MRTLLLKKEKKRRNKKRCCLSYYFFWVRFRFPNAMRALDPQTVFPLPMSPFQQGMDKKIEKEEPMLCYVS